MIGLVFWAAVCALAAALFIALPLLRSGHDQGPTEPLLAAVTATLVLATAGILYPMLSHGSWHRSTGDSLGNITALLAATDDHPDDVQAWLNLGRAYLGIQQWPLARRSFQHADRLSNGSNAAALSGLGQTIVFENNGSETEASTALFTRALQRDPHSPQALFYTGVALLHAGDLTSARQRFAAMRELGPPPQIMDALDRQISAIDDEIKRLKPDPATAIHLRVTLAPALEAKVPAGATLFVFVRAPQGGPPLAVKRLAATFPQQVDLSAADSVLAGNRLTAGQHVQVMARVSAHGAPVAGPGDLYGELSTVAGGAGTHAVAIDRQTP